MELKKIELDNLEEVLCEHSYAFQKATDGLASAKKEVAECKLTLDQVESALYLNTRTKFESSGEKFTEGKLTHTIRLDDSFIHHSKAYIEAKMKLNHLENLKEVFLQREGVIKNLGHLYAAQYWSLSSLDKKRTLPKEQNPDSPFMSEKRETNKTKDVYEKPEERLLYQ